MPRLKGDNPFIEYQTRKVADNEARIRSAIANAAKKKTKLSYPLMSKMTGIPYPTLKSRGPAGKKYRALIDPAIFRSKDWKIDSEMDLPVRSPITLEEAKAHVSVLSYNLESAKKQIKELREIIKNPETLLSALGFKSNKPPKLPELSLAKDFCDLIDRLIETCHLEVDANGNIIGKGLHHDVRAPRGLAAVYLTWKQKK